MDRMEARTLIDETIRREVGRVIEQEVGRALRVMGMPVAEGREERPLLGAGDAGPYAEAQEIARQTAWRTVRPVSGGDVSGWAKHVELVDTPIGYLPLGDWTRRR